MHGIKKVRGDATDDITIETISQNLDIDVAPYDIERTHRIGHRDSMEGNHVQF